MGKRPVISIIIGFFCFLLLSKGVVFASSEYVIDELNYLTSSEIDELETEILSLRDGFGLDAVIVITDETDGKSSMDFADDYFDYNNYGVNGEGILMLINMDIREVWISTAGDRTITTYEPYISSMVDQIINYLKNQDYNGACARFLNIIKDVESGVLDSTSSEVNNSNETSDNSSVTKSDNYSGVNEKPITLNRGTTLSSDITFSMIPFIIGIISASIATVVITLSNKGKVTITSRTYESKEGFHLVSQIDNFTNEIVTSRIVETNANKGMGGSGHIGSSGRSHGGGGGRF